MENWGDAQRGPQTQSPANGVGRSSPIVSNRNAQAGTQKPIKGGVMQVRDLLTVTFIARTYRKRNKRSRKGFKFPQELKNVFGFRGRRCEVALRIMTFSGDTLFCGISTFISGAEITDAATVGHIDFDQDICQGRWKISPAGRSKTRPAEGLGSWRRSGFEGRMASGAEACAGRRV